MPQVTILPRRTNFIIQQKAYVTRSATTFFGYIVDGSSNKLIDGSSNYIMDVTTCNTPVITLLPRNTNVIIEERQDG